MNSRDFDTKRLRTACFTGHRELDLPPETISEKTMRVVESFIQRGYLYFGAGGARGFDAIASEAVLSLKERYPVIHLILVLPFDRQYEHEGGWTVQEIEQYHMLKERASKVVILESGYSSGVYYRRNQHLIDASSLCLAYQKKAASGTGYTVNYAHKQGLMVINIANK